MDLIRRSLAGLTTVVTVLAMASCGSQPGPGGGPAGQGWEPDGKGSPTATPEAPAVLTKADGALVKGLSTSTFTDDGRKIRAEVPTIDSARQASSAMEVLRERALREATWDRASEVRVDWQLLAAGQGVLGLQVTPQWKSGDRTGGRPAVVWYDATTRGVYSSPALIGVDQWSGFKNEVAKVAGGKADPVRLSQSLDSEAAPQGNGPTIGFDKQGNTVVSFAAGTAADRPLAVAVPAAAMQPLLSELGHRAHQASTQPEAFDGTAPAAPATASPTPSGGTSSNSVARPSTAVGVDCRKAQCVALTYDDGPGPDTKTVLDALSAGRVPATFFQIGQSLKADPATGRSVAANGNEVGSHSYTHPNLAGISSDKLNTEVERTADTFKEVYGRRPTILRPPYGSHNKGVDQVVGRSGAAIIQWDLDTNDWKTRNTASTTTAATGAKANSIVLMHDIHPSTTAAAAGIVQGLKDKGITPVTISELSLNSPGMEAGHAYCSGTSVKSSGFNCNG